MQKLTSLTETERYNFRDFWAALNTFYIISFFLYSLKTSENLWFSYVDRG